MIRRQVAPAQGADGIHIHIGTYPLQDAFPTKNILTAREDDRFFQVVETDVTFILLEDPGKPVVELVEFLLDPLFFECPFLDARGVVHPFES